MVHQPDADLPSAAVVVTCSRCTETVCTGGLREASQQSNGMVEAFVNTMRRDYVDGADLSTATVVLAQLPEWTTDYNHMIPHLALGYQAPVEYRRTMVTP